METQQESVLGLWSHAPQVQEGGAPHLRCKNGEAPALPQWATPPYSPTRCNPSFLGAEQMEFLLLMAQHCSHPIVVLKHFTVPW